MPQVTPKKPARPKLSVILDKYLETQRLDKVGEKTIGDKRSVTQLLIRIVGDLPINDYKREQAQRFKDVVLQLPPRTPCVRLVTASNFQLEAVTYESKIYGPNDSDAAVEKVVESIRYILMSIEERDAIIKYILIICSLLSSLQCLNGQRLPNSELLACVRLIHH
jgi:hypothetical protein